MLNAIKSFDQSIILLVDRTVTNEFIITFFNFFSFIGNAAICWILLFIGYSVIKRDRNSWNYWGITFLSSFVFSELLLKNIIRRSRPFIELANLTIQTIKPSSFSFPSGHSLFAGAAVFVFFKLEKNKWARIFVLIVSILIPLSRVILKVHYPSDVIAGYSLGILIAFIVSKIVKIKGESDEN